MKTLTFTLFVFFATALIIGCNGNAQSNSKSVTAAEKTYKVTFYELGLVRCIPCQQMQPVLKSIVEKQTDDDWKTVITTKEFGTKTKAEAFGRIVSHTAYHSGQVAIVNKYGIN